MSNMNTLENWANKGFVILSLLAVIALTSCEQETIEPDFVETVQQRQLNIVTGGDDDPAPPCSNCQQ